MSDIIASGRPLDQLDFVPDSKGLEVYGVKSAKDYRALAGFPGGPATLDPGTGAVPDNQMKPEIVAAPGRLDAAEARLGVVEAGQTAGMLGYADKTTMDGDLARAAGTLALVSNDSTPVNNGTYRKIGAIGAGSWVKSDDRLTGLEGETSNYRAAGDPIIPAATPGYVFSIEDAAGNVALGILPDGTVEVSKLEQTGNVPIVAERHGGKFDASINLIVGFGQSLMMGSTNFGTPLTTTQEYDNVGFKRVEASPTAYYPLTVADTAQSAGESPIYGCAGFIKELVEKENGLTWRDNNYQLLMVNDGQSGASITLLEKGGVSGKYEVAQSQVVSAKTIADAQGRTMKHQAVIFAQGEADDAMTKDDYKAKFVKLARDFDIDSRAATGQATPVYLITYQVGEYAGRNSTVQAQYEAALECPQIVMAMPIYFMDFISPVIDGAGNTHLTAESSKWQGAYYGLAYKRKVVDGQDWVPLRPVAHAVNGNTIDLYMSKRGLVFDTTLMPAQVNQGFTVKDAANSDVAITSVSIIAGDRVRITCASNVEPGWSVQYGHINVVGKDNYTHCGGNLRDSQGELIVYAVLNKPMHNWCVIFNYWL
jgi:hypothetical protein